jgi:MFS family permease
MTVEAYNQGAMDLLHIFRRRALISGIITASLGILCGWLASSYAPYLFAGLTSRALPLAAILAGLLDALALLLSLYYVARILAAAAVALVLGAWAVAQYPYLIVPYITIAQAASPPGVLAIVLIATVVTVILVLPSMWYMLYLLFKSRHRRRSPITTNQYIESLMKRTEAEIDEVSAPNGSSHHHGVPSAIRSVVAVIAAVGIAIAASVVSHTWQRWCGAAHQRPESTPPPPSST